MEIGKAKSASDSTFFLCPYVRLWATSSSMRLACGRPLPRQGSLPDTRRGRKSPCTWPNFAGGRSRPPAGTLFTLAQASAEAEEVYPGTRPNFAAPAGAPVYRRADRSEPNRRLFTAAQTGVNQTGACLLSRRLHRPKQAPVYHRADCVAPNRRLFILAQTGVNQTGALSLHPRSA